MLGARYNHSALVWQLFSSAEIAMPPLHFSEISRGRGSLLRALANAQMGQSSGHPACHTPSPQPFWVSRGIWEGILGCPPMVRTCRNAPALCARMNQAMRCHSCMHTITASPLGSPPSLPPLHPACTPLPKPFGHQVSKLCSIQVANKRALQPRCACPTGGAGPQGVQITGWWGSARLGDPCIQPRAWGGGAEGGACTSPGL